MKIRITALVLLMSMLLTLAACSSDTGDDAAVTTVTEAAETETETEETTADAFEADGLLDLDFGGKTVSIYVRGDTIDTEFTADNDGDIVNDALYTRNMKVEERLNVDLNIFANTTTDFWGQREIYMNTVIAAVMAGDKSIDIAGGLSVLHPIMIQNDIFFDMLGDGMEHLEFTRPWWSTSLIDKLAVGGRLYLASGEASLGVIKGMMCFLFNKKQISDFGLDDPYKLVTDGKWTLDALREMSAVAYQDLNGDGAVDVGDNFGLVIDNENHAVNFTTACGLTPMSYDSEGVPHFDMASEKFVDVMDRCKEMVEWDSSAVNFDNKREYAEAFPSGRAMFITAEFASVVIFRDSDTDFGVIPFPKYDEAQDRYITTPRSTFSAFSIPITADKEITSAVLEAFASESYRTVSPAYFESALKVKYSRDEISAQMFDIIKGGVEYDFGLTSAQMLKAFNVTLRGVICGSNKSNWTTVLAANQSSYDAALEAYLETLMSLKN